MASIPVWRILHYPAGVTPSREYLVRARSRETAKRKLVAALRVPAWTLR